jgi:hypothetical protein
VAAQVEPPMIGARWPAGPVESAIWTAAGELDYSVRDTSEWLARHLAAWTQSVG